MHSKNNDQASYVLHPTFVPLPSPCTEVVAGPNHSYAISKVAVYLWGAPLDRPNPFPSQDLLTIIPIKVKHLATGPTHTFAWNERQVYCWGSNQYYQLGLEEEQKYTYQRVQLLEQAFEQGRQLQGMACGQHHTLAVFRRDSFFSQEEDGPYEGKEVSQKQSEDVENGIQLFGWGQSQSYQLTLNTPHIIPQPVVSPCSFHHLQQIQSRSDYNIAICNQTVYTWGCNLFSRLGSHTQDKVRIPRAVPLPIKVIKVGIGKCHVVALGLGGEGYAWGKGNQGQLGSGRLEVQSSPIKMECSEWMSDVACGQAHTLVLLRSGRLMSCGSNSHRVLGHNHYDPLDKKKRCVRLEFLEGTEELGEIVLMSCGASHNLVLNKEGQVFAWGSNSYHQTLPDVESETQPVHRSMKHPRKSLQIIVDDVGGFESDQKMGEQERMQTRILDWHRRYQEFRANCQRQEEVLMGELQTILAGRHS